jgi:cell wall-associated NlpC family hydrolase
MAAMSPRRTALALMASLPLAAPCWALQLETQLRTVPPEPAVDAERAVITGYLRANLGEPYRYGATDDEEAFDCSSLVQRAYEAAGLDVPRASREQLAAGEPVALDALQAGDLLFYRMRANAPQRLHVVVYIGEGRAIHASFAHREVREIDITGDTWRRKLIAARSLL